MKQVAIIDFNYTKTHVGFAETLIRRFSKICDVLLIAKKGYYSLCSFPNNVEVVELDLPQIEGNPLKTRMLMHKSAKLQAKELKKHDVSNVIVLAYEEIAFHFSYPHFKQYNLFLVQHQNIDYLCESKIKRMFFKRYANKVNHIMLDEFILHGAEKELGLNKEKMLIYNTIEDVRVDEYATPCDDNKLFVSLSNLNDEDVVKQIIDKEKSEGFLAKNKIKWIIKSKKYVFESDFLTVFNGFLPLETYNDYFKKATGIVFFYPQTYKFRMSGGINEALGMCKEMFFIDSILGNVFSKKYPALVTNTKTVDEMFEVFKNYKSQNKEKYWLEVKNEIDEASKIECFKEFLG